jgi:hypothetical protein
MANRTIDVFLARDGRVVTDPRQAVEMRRTVLDEQGRLVETSVWYTKDAQQRQPEFVPNEKAVLRNKQQQAGYR